MPKAPAVLTVRIWEVKISALIGETVIFRMYSTAVNTTRQLNAEKRSNKINCLAHFTEWKWQQFDYYEFIKQTKDLPAVFWHSFDMHRFFLYSFLLCLYSWYRSVNKRDWLSVCLSVTHTPQSASVTDVHVKYEQLTISDVLYKDGQFNITDT